MTENGSMIGEVIYFSCWSRFHRIGSMGYRYWWRPERVRGCKTNGSFIETKSSAPIAYTGEVIKETDKMAWVKVHATRYPGDDHRDVTLPVKRVKKEFANRRFRDDGEW